MPALDPPAPDPARRAGPTWLRMLLRRRRLRELDRRARWAQQVRGTPTLGESTEASRRR